MEKQFFRHISPTVRPRDLETASVCHNLTMPDTYTPRLSTTFPSQDIYLRTKNERISGTEACRDKEAIIGKARIGGVGLGFKSLRPSYQKLFQFEPHRTLSDIPIYPITLSLSLSLSRPRSSWIQVLAHTHITLIIWNVYCTA